MDATAVNEIAIEPIIHYPQTAKPGQSYLMSVDLRPSLTDLSAWPYEREEYVVNCQINTGDLFTVEPLGDASIIVHRFGGTYGPARFLLTAARTRMDGCIRITLINGWGIPLDSIELNNVHILDKEDSFSTVLEKEDELSLQVRLRSIQQQPDNEYLRAKLFGSSSSDVQKTTSHTTPILNTEDDLEIIYVLQNPQMYPTEIWQAAIAHFYTAHVGLISNYYQRKFEIAREDAEDLAHELLIIIIYTKIFPYQRGVLDDEWLMRVAHNWYLNQQRRDRRTIPIGDGDDDESEVPPSEQMMDRAAGRYPEFLSAHQRMSQEGLSNIEVVEMIGQSITQAKLTKSEADVAWLILYYELKPSEIVALMPNQTAANISRIWWNAKQKLKSVSL